MNRLSRALSHERLYWLSAILWVVLLLPDLGARYSFGWDSSQFDRAVSDFDLIRHHPHPPGYPLWVLALRGVTPLVGNPNRAQVLLAMLFTAAALWFFRAQARELLGERGSLAATVLLAFSPVVCLNANSSQVYAVDLFLSCFAGWVAAGLCSGRSNRAVPGLAVVALASGCRPSGGVFLFPLLGLALWQCGRKRPLQAGAGLLAGAACWLAWLVPTALMTGGFSVLAALNHAQMESSFRKTSVFYGAAPIVHAHKVVEVSLYFAMALCAFLIPVAVSLRLRRTQEAAETAHARPAWATPVFFLLWLAPNLALVYVFHCSQPGYILLSVPPLALLLGWLARGRLKRPEWAAAGLAAALLVSYFPYEKFILATQSRLPFLFLRATPRISRLNETSQRELRTLIDSMPGRPEEKLLVCLRSEFEAPDIRTVTYDFADVVWADYAGARLRVFLPHEAGVAARVPTTVHSVAWLCDGRGLPVTLARRYPDIRRIAGNPLYSFWVLPERGSQAEAILRALPTNDQAAGP